MSGEGVIEKPAFEVAGLRAGYGAFEILHGVDLTCNRGEVVMIMGHNGAGKSTFVKGSLGLTGFMSGVVSVQGMDVAGYAASRRISAGLGYVPQVSGIFPSFSVRQNLVLGAYTVSKRQALPELIEEAYGRFPILGKLAGKSAGLLSGGQQRLLSVAMAMMTHPSVILIDEPSAGLAPNLVLDLMDDIARIRDEESVAVVLVEQNIRAGLRIADRIYVFRDGVVLDQYSVAQMSQRESYWDLL